MFQKATKLCLVLFVSVIIILSLDTSHTEKFIYDVRTGATPSIGKNGCPPGRFEYEFMRLKNPQTGEIPRGIARRELDFARRLQTAESVRSARLYKQNRTSPSTWKHRGPYNIGGRTRALGLDIRDENIILAGGVSGGMWKSTDSGQSWRKTTLPNEIQSVTCLVQDTRTGEEDTWYYGTGEYRGSWGISGDGIFKSTDNGDHWTLLEATSTNTPERLDHDFDWTWRLALDTSNLEEDEIYAAAYGSIYRSVDGGVTWDCVLGGEDEYGGRRAHAYTDIVISETGVLYAALSWGLDQGIWRSEDGVQWTNITPVDWPSFFARVIIAMAPSNENVVYFFSDITEEYISFDI